MSISRRHAGSLPALAAGVLLFTTGITSAAETDFIPRFNLKAGRQGNVTIVGNRPIPDNYIRIGADLVFSSKTERTSFSLSYRPSWIYYREFSELDFGEHRFSTTLDRTFEPGSTMVLDLHVYSGQGQGINPDQPDAPITLVPRTDMNLGKLELRKDTTTGELSAWKWGVGSSVVRYDKTLGTTLENSETLFADLGYDRDLSERISLGGVYDFQYFQYESARSAKVHTFLAVGNFTLGEFTNLRFGLGGFYAEGGANNVSDPSGELVVTRKVGERSSLSAGITQRVSVGTGLQQATLDRGGYLAWNIRITRDISATVNGSFWRREDLSTLNDEAQVGTRTFLTSSTLTWSILPSLGVGIFHAYSDQDTLGSAESALDTSYPSGGFTVRWNPRGR